MKKINVFLMIVLILLIAFAVYFFVGGTLKASVSTITAPASDHPDAFASIRNVLDSHSAPQQFGEISNDPGLYTLMDVTVSLANHGVFAAEWIDAAVTPANGDVAVYSLTGEGSDVPARSVSQINLKIITTNPAAPRSIRLTYYVHGMLRTIDVATGV